MTSESIIALVAVVVSGVVGVASLAFNLWNSSQERQNRIDVMKWEQEERYRVRLYGKRLDVHQQAFEWLCKAVEPLKRARSSDARQEDRDELAAICKDAQRWWDANCLYLDPSSRDKMHAFIWSAGRWAAAPSDPVWKTYPDSTR